MKDAMEEVIANFRSGTATRKDVERLKELADRGNTKAALNYGICLFIGNLTDEDREEASRYFEQVYLLGKIEELINLSAFYDETGGFAYRNMSDMVFDKAMAMFLELPIEEQFASYEAQVDYYTKYINSRPDWEFVNVYTDEGISGTNTKKRSGFNNMIKDALDGKIDLIVTKSVSRFARNTVDSLVNIRKLKAHNVECYFEKENIYTFDSKGELLITIMSSLAQEESRSISENVTWGQRKRFADGKVSIPYKSFLGFRKGENGQIEIDEKEAGVVRRIYHEFMGGSSYRQIAISLIGDGIPTPCGKTKWEATTIISILRNEKYKGDALLQKRFTIDFLSHKTKANEGEVPQYCVQDSHPAIIPKEEWEMVQAEIYRRKHLGHEYSYRNPFFSKLVCGDCGKAYGVKVWHSNLPGRKKVLQCNDKFKNKCKTPVVSLEDVKRRFLFAYNNFFVDSEQTIKDIELAKVTITNTDGLDAKIEEASRELEEQADEFRLLVRASTASAQDQETWKRRHAELLDRYREKEEKLAKMQAERRERKAKEKRIDSFIDVIRKKGCLLEWNGEIFNFVTDKVIVNRDKSLTFVFVTGYEATIAAGD